MSKPSALQGAFFAGSFLVYLLLIPNTQADDSLTHIAANHSQVHR